MPRTTASGRTSRGGSLSGTGRAAGAGRTADTGSGGGGGGALSGVTLGAIVTSPTMRSIGIELPFTETSGTLTRVQLEFKRNVDGSYRNGLDIWPTRPAGYQSAAYGSVLLCDPNTLYDLRLTAYDALGGSTTMSVVQATTSADAIPAYGSLTPTRFLRADGSDSNAGTADSAGGAWLTLLKAMTDTPAGGILKIGAGYYQSVSTDAANLRNGAITIIGANPPVNDTGTVINAGSHSVIEGPAVASPTGSGGPNAGIWTSQSVAGPGAFGLAPANYTVWKWASSPVTDPVAGGYGATRGEIPQSLPRWAWEATVTGQALDTVGKWAEACQTNRQYRAGFWSGGTSDIYVSMLNGDTPNSYWWSFSSADSNGFIFNSIGNAVYNLVIRNFRRGIYGQVGKTIVDHCWVSGCYHGVAFGGLANVDSVAQYCRIDDKGTTDASVLADGALLSWDIVKAPMKGADGTNFGNKLCGWKESAGVNITNEANRVTIRNNLFTGVFDAVGNSGQDPPTRYWGHDVDVHDNVFQLIADDGGEPEHAVINQRWWHNRFDRVVSAISLGPVHYGPVYFFLNTVFRPGSAHLGTNVNGTRPQATGVCIKFSQKSLPQTRLFYLHNTCWIDQTANNFVDWAHDSAGGGTLHEAFYLRNNLIRSTAYIIDETDAVPLGWDEDYNFFCTTDTTRGIKVVTVNYSNQNNPVNGFGAYRTATGMGAHSNLLGSTTYELNAAGTITTFAGFFTDPTNGDLTLAVSSPVKAIGVLVPNISDRPTIDYSGALPNLGSTP